MTFRRGRFAASRFATGPVRRGRFAASRLISVFRETNGDLISTIESVDAPKNVFSLSTNK
jgi:hypothetical protein